MSYLKHTLRAQLIISSVIACAHVHAQAPARQSKAESAFASLRYSDAVRYFKDEHRDASGSEKQAAIAARIADCYWLMRNYDSAYHWYGTLPAQAMQSNVKAKVRMSDLLATRGDYGQAAKMLEGLPGYAQKAAGFKNVGALKADAADWNIQYLESVNTPQFREFSPALTGTGLIWSTNLPVKGGSKGVMGWDNQRYTGLMVAADRAALTAGAVPAAGASLVSKTSSGSTKRLAENYDLADFERSRRVVVPADLKDQVAKILKVANPVNIVGGLSYNQAHAGFHVSSGQLYFSANRQEKLKNKTRTVGIAASSLQSAVANDVKFIFADGGDHSLMHPAIHADGSTLVFASDKPGGSGGFDLYVSTRSTEGVWSDPRPLTSLNTEGNELFPSFGQNGKLYFSSDARQGLGCLDIYSADFSSGTAKNVTHLSYPVNSAYDDFGMTVSQDGKMGYFTSDRLGSDDIYQFSFEEKKTKVSGVVKSEQSNGGKQGVEVVLDEKTPNGDFQQKAAAKTDQKGEFAFDVKPGRDYRVSFIDGDKKVSKNISPDMLKNTTLKLDEMVVHDAPPPAPTTPQPSEPAVAPEPTSFKLNFDFNAAVVRMSDYEVLAKVKTAMDADGSLICNLSGHADAAGSASYNLGLSRKRANAVKTYLVSIGMKGSRIKTEYFGSTKLILVTDDRDEAEVNRRVEIDLIKK
jgi:outer membrane protein OmpA-like peptidoglycan-associated protein